MPSSYDLTTLDPRSFEHLANAIAMRVLGAGHTGFAPGADGGRDGLFEGPAPYPSAVNHWDGSWYIQSKFHAPHASHNPQKWLVACVRDELKAFADPKTRRQWPDNWILVTNVDPTGVAKTGSFDQTRTLVKAANGPLADRFHIWGGSKLMEFLNQYPDIADRYGHFLSPGHVISKLYHDLGDARASGAAVIKHLVVSGLEDHKHTKLEQAGSEADKRPGIHTLFVDLPFRSVEHQSGGLATVCLASAASQVQRLDPKLPTTDAWLQWRRHPMRAPVWFVKGGPGQGKSTIGQYFCQIQRAALILQGDGLTVHPEIRQLAEDIRGSQNAAAIWPAVPRIPIQLELKEYAKWYAETHAREPRGVLTYLSTMLTSQIEQPVAVGTLRRLLRAQSWVVVFDGLDEVPASVKDEIAKEIHTFLRDASAEADVLTICTSRPQGYSGQFDSLYGVASAELVKLPESTAFECGALLIQHTLPRVDAERSIEVLKNALRSPAVQELMTTPLQSHIMAIIVRGGQRPPEKKWELYNRFYDVIRAREANRELPDKALSSLLREDVALLKAVHNRLGFLLHSEAERAEGAQAKLSRSAFRQMVEAVVREQKEYNIAEITATVLSATTERLVLISTPDDGAHVRFDVRQLQEYFAAEYLYYGVTPETLGRRLEHIIGDAHWREVMHFLLSALALGHRKAELAVACQALRATDNGDSDGLDGTFAGSLARGALVAARLLQDGVLEPDKGVRNFFYDIVARVAPIRDSDALAPLWSIRGSASEAWTTELMVRRVRDADSRSSVGAALYLVRTLRDGHSFVPTLKAIIRASPAWYRRALVEALVAVAATQASLRQWIVDLLVEASSEWSASGLAGVRLFSQVCEAPELASAFLAKIEQRFDTALHDVFSLYRRDRHTRDEAISREDYGWLSVGVPVGGPLEDPRIRSIAKGIRASVPAGGLTGLLAAGTHFACYQDKHSYIDILNALGSDWPALYELPPDIYIRMPRFDAAPQEVASVVGNMTDEQFVAALHTRTFDRFRAENLIFEVRQGEGSVVSTDDSSALFERYPRWATMWWVRQASIGDPVALSPGITGLAIETGLKSASARRELAAPVWGLAFSGPHGTALRKMVVSDCFSPALGFGAWWFDEEIQFKPIVLELPEDAPLLPRLASDLLSIHTSGGLEFVHRRRRGAASGGDERVRACCSLVESYVPRADALESVALNPGYSEEIRAGAVLLLMLHPHGDRAAACRFPELFTVASSGTFSPGAALGLAVDLLHTEREPAVSRVLGAIIDAALGGSTDWRTWNRLFARWRERSTAPVTSKGVGFFLVE